MYKLAFKSLNVSLITHLSRVSKSEFLIINAAIFIYDPQRRSCFMSKGQETCCEKSCDIIYNCLRKHPRYCRYFWGFDSCRNGESCKFLHKTEATNNIDADKYKELEQKYNDILEKYNNMVSRIESLENVNKTCTRSRSALSRSRGDGKRNIPSG